MLLAWTLALTLCGVAATANAQQRVLRHDESAPGRLDPSKVVDYASSVLAMNVYDTLVNGDPSGGVAPSLAESWTLSADGKVYTFKLKPGVKFHGGGEMTSEDVLFALERTLALNAGYARLFKGVTGTAPDARTVVLTLPAPNAAFLATLVRLPVMQKSLVLKNVKPGNYGDKGDYGEAFLAERDAGSGAYRVVEHNPQEQSVLAKFDGYFGQFATNAPDVVRIRYGVEPATVRTLMARREFEVTSQWIPSEIKRALAETEGMSVISERGAGYFIMPMNTTRPPTDDPHFRRAVALGLDYTALIELMKVTPNFAGAVPITGMLPSGLLGHDKTLPANRRDVAAAKAELAKSKYASNQPIMELIWVGEVPLEEKIGLLVLQNLAEIGIKVNLTKVPWTLLTQQVTKAETTPNMTQRFVSAPYPDPDALISQNHSRYKSTTLKMDWYSDGESDKLIEAALAVTDQGKRRELYGQVQRRLLDATSSIYPFETVATFVKQNYTVAPMLDDTSKGVAVQGGNWMFRTFSVNK
ncbi:MAG: ABC transporter substrate-binding protein [Proteobacteria bacterium]|nr:ABC transporter substrate-binding protein [Pseudomonadota bacterium]